VRTECKSFGLLRIQRPSERLTVPRQVVIVATPNMGVRVRGSNRRRPHQSATAITRRTTFQTLACGTRQKQNATPRKKTHSDDLMRIGHLRAIFSGGLIASSRLMFRNPTGTCPPICVNLRIVAIRSCRGGRSHSQEAISFAGGVPHPINCPRILWRVLSHRRRGTSSSKLGVWRNRDEFGYRGVGAALLCALAQSA
jgi:hypothetical protein